MFHHRSPIPWSIAVAALVTFFILSVSADVVLNEIVASSSERLLKYDASGAPQVGTGLRWYDPAFNDVAWQAGMGPFGFGALTSPPTPVATDLQASVQYLATTTYFRKTFQINSTDQTRPDPVQLVVDYNDGFVAFLNGVEVARRNAGPSKKWIYHDQPAYNRESFKGTAPIPTTVNSETINLGAASTVLSVGTNVIAIHLLNASALDGTFYLKAGLQIGGALPSAIVRYNDPWKFFPGVVEPAGNVFDPAQLGAGKQRVPWGTATFDDLAWSSGPGPFGFGAVGGIGTNVQAAMLNITPSLYQRIVFNATNSQASDSQALKLIVSNDDGFVAYINGVEVARRRIGLPNTFTPFDAVADSDQAAVQTETIVLDAASKLLVAGANILAIQAHNYSANNADFLMKVDLQTNSGATLVANSSVWKYLPGLAEPIPDQSGAEDSSPEGPNSVNDWIELYNNGAAPVSLQGWRLTDDPSETNKWVFPNVTIPAGGYLVVVADNADLKNNPDGYLHTNFGLNRGGEYLGLYDQNGGLRSELAPGFPAQTPFYSYARNGAGVWLYSDLPTPGAANAGNFFSGIVAPPTPSAQGRFYSSAQNVTFSTSTPGATIRYTTNGSEPTTVSAIASGPVGVTASTVLRARAFVNGLIPSDIATHTYLIGQSSARRSLPAMCLTGDEQQVFYRPFGVFAIVTNNTSSANGPTNYTGGVWSSHPGATTLNPPDTAEDPSLYNAPIQSGQPAERTLTFEVLHADGGDDLRIGAFLRCAGSPASRPAYFLTNQNSATPNSASPWSINSREKPQLNLFFRKDVGPSPLHYPLIPGSTVTQYDNIRLRAGKNDISNPFIRDEFSRRSIIDMGQVTVRGDFCNVFVNAVFKGYFNQCERPREPFFQEARHSNLKFDVRNITAIVDGDTLAFNEAMSFAKTHPMSSLANYQGLQSRLDVANFADYILFNAHAAMGDWPVNNYVMDRERSTAGLIRFSVWDGEGGYGGFGRNPAYKIFNDINSTNVAIESTPVRLFYTVAKQSPEFRQLFADRIQRALFNGGALTEAALQTRFNTLAARIQPIMTEVIAQNVTPFMNIWINGQGDTTRYTFTNGTTGTIVNCPSRRTALFTGFTDDTAGGVFVPGSFVSEGLWPATNAPVFSSYGGQVAQNYPLAMTNPNGAGVIYFTTNGLDPRAVGGTVQGSAYTAPFVIDQPLIVKARVLGASGEWSPLIEAAFQTPTPPALIFSEIMYHPPTLGSVSGDEFEFLEIKNVGATTINLSGMHFTQGIVFTFPPNMGIAPGAFVVLAKNPLQFAMKYPAVQVSGSYGPASSLSNSGETVTLVDATGATVFSANYSDNSPWPQSADGGGYSLVPVNPNAIPAPNSAASWRASAHIGGSPGADDPNPAITFDAWRALNFTAAELADFAISGPDADPDHDGIANLWEFAHGLNPRVADATKPVSIALANDAGGGPYLTLTYRRNLAAQNLQLEVDTAGTPGVWSFNGGVPVGVPVNNGDGTETVKKRDTVGTGAASQRFIRLRGVSN